MADSDLHQQPNTQGPLGPIVAAYDLDGKAIRAVLPAMALVGANGSAIAGGTNPLPVRSAATGYQAVAASQTDKALGATGAAGDFLANLIISVATAATAAVSIKDGAGSSIPILANSPGGGIGIYEITIGAVSTSGAWKVTTGAGSTVLATGNFT